MTLGPFNVIVRCVSAAQCTSSVQHWTKNEQFTLFMTSQSIRRQPWPGRPDLLLLSRFSPALHCLHIMFFVFLCSLCSRCARLQCALPSTSSVLRNILQCLAQTVDSQRQQKCFYIKASFASHSWCGGGPRDTTEGG